MQTLIKWVAFTSFFALTFVYARWVVNVNRELRLELDGGSAQDLPQWIIEACKDEIAKKLENPRSIDWGDSQQWPTSYDAPLWTIGATISVQDSSGQTTAVSVVCEALHGRIKARLIN